MLTKVFFLISFIATTVLAQNDWLNSVVSRANDDDSGCVTQEGRPGSCVRSGTCQMVKDETDIPVCYTLPFFGTKYICCPSTDRPGVYPKESPGKLF